MRFSVTTSESFVGSTPRAAAKQFLAALTRNGGVFHIYGGFGRKLTLTVRQPRRKHAWDQPDATYPLDDWKYEVDNNDTRLGYWDWVEHQKEQNRPCRKM